MVQLSEHAFYKYYYHYSKLKIWLTALLTSRFKITSQNNTLLPLSLNMAANPAVLEYLKYLPDDKLKIYII
jgi:hypothetical protein